MRAMVLERAKAPLILKQLPIPRPSPLEVLIRVHACAICRTDLHILDGELAKPRLPLIPGHQIVGIVEETGDLSDPSLVGKRVGVPWLGGCCEHCHFCLSGKENLCAMAIYTGYQINGGFAEYCVADSRFVFLLPDEYSDEHAAPLLCGGMIGYRALSMTENAKSIGFYGFGSSAHLLIQIANYQKRDVYVFTRPGDIQGQKEALKHGAKWVGSSEDLPPKQLEAAIIFAPVGQLVVNALHAVDKGGIVVCAGIYMSDIPSFPYADLWEERVIRSVANLTRKDGQELLEIAPKIPIKTEITTYPLEETNRALDDLRESRITGTGVIIVV